MDNSVFLLLGFVVIVIIATGFRVRKLKRLSEEQWKKVDHSKLREWVDDDD